MPVYEYLCSACGKLQDAIQKFSDAPLTDCELCGGMGTLAKQISRSSFALKGTGWYTTDYKRAPAAKAAETGKAAEASAGESGKAEAAKSEGAVPTAAVAKPAAEKTSTPASSTKA